jgi:hypothetical protein
MGRQDVGRRWDHASPAVAAVAASSRFRANPL